LVEFNERVGIVNMSRIARVIAWEVLDSRGWPTVAAEIECDDGSRGMAIAPSGASTGRAEAKELRDGDPARYDGKGVQTAARNVLEIIGPALLGLDPVDQTVVDRTMIELDATVDKSRLGGNAILAVSLAAAHAAAAVSRIPLYEHICSLAKQAGVIAPGTLPRMPLPMINMISGGLHAGGNLAFQDFLIVPHGTREYPEQLEWTARIYHRLGEWLRDRGWEGHLVGDEGGYGPKLSNDVAALEAVVQAIEGAGLRPGEQVSIALDVASSQFYREGLYVVGHSPADRWSSEQLVNHLARLVEQFPIVSIEDGQAEDDWEGWQRLTRRLGGRVKLVGDDLFATNGARLERGIAQGVANSVLIKPNQIGTLSETLQTMRIARESGYQCVVSARSGETEDTTLADLAVGTCGELIKIGSVARSERLAKYNRLLRIGAAGVRIY
jgi:enolase